ncbi:MAG TPA: rod shape-determining protein MreC [Chloroflexota bacterium]|jgi:rod shape-determining protein MreC
MVEARGGRRFAVAFLVAAFLVLLLGKWVKPVNLAALSVAAPFASVASAVATDTGDVVSGVTQGNRWRDENKSLQDQVGIVVRQNMLLQAQLHDYKLLQSMLSFDELNNHMEFLTARVIMQDPNGLAPYILINRGTRDGLRRGMTVVTDHGYFVGSIIDLTSNAAKVQLVTSPSSSVGALDLKTRATGLVEGQYSGLLQLHWVVANSTLRKLDFIVTSGQENLFPRTILIGQVMSVQHQNSALFQSAVIQPAADFSNLEIVQVIRNFIPSAPNRLIGIK